MERNYQRQVGQAMTYIGQVGLGRRRVRNFEIDYAQKPQCTTLGPPYALLALVALPRGLGDPHPSFLRVGHLYTIPQSLTSRTVEVFVDSGL